MLCGFNIEDLHSDLWCYFTELVVTKQKLHFKAGWESTVSEKTDKIYRGTTVWLVGFLWVDGGNQWDFVLFFIEIFRKKSARQNGEGNTGRECSKAGWAVWVWEGGSCGRWRRAAHLGSRMKQSTAMKLLSKTNEHLYFSELIAYHPFQELLPLCSP